MPKSKRSGEGDPLLFIPYCQKPFLENKKKVRGKNRQIFERLEQVVSELRTALDRNDIDSKEVIEDSLNFLVFVEGPKKVSQRR
ncbi:hypothetical protein [Microcoleus asticus]|uniref:Uncharacterized protein n=1 Tax=Microcoleus asticus IPMA8 TaxID=2563858 RepID=A0ABX2D058_9CYAN|nr:hypothetical protein [Microcoleus asticus]NQE35235.1 hypothetical protein [Microcoleus asticus IPMA8]